MLKPGRQIFAGLISLRPLLPIAIAAAIVGVIWLAVDETIEGHRHSELAAAQKISETSARIFAEHAERSFAAADEEIQRLRDRLNVMSAAELTPDRVLSHLDGAGPANLTVRRLTVVSAEGRVVASTYKGRASAGLDVSTASPFIFHRDQPKDQLRVTRPAISKLTNSVDIFVTRRLETKSGAFAGIISAAIDPAVFSNLYAHALAGSNNLISLIDAQGEILASGRARETKTNEVRLAETAGATKADGQSPGAAHPSAHDTILQVGNYPLFVIADMQDDLILPGAFAVESRIKTLALTFSVILMLVSVTITLFRMRAEGVSRVMEKIEQANRDAAELRRIQNDRLVSLIENLPQGVSLFDQAGRLIVCNRHFIEMYDLPADTHTSGATYADIHAHVTSKNSHGGGEGWEPPAEMAAIATAGDSCRIENLRDGRFISVTRHGIATGGWVASYSDITESRLQQARILELARQDPLTGIANRTAFREHLDEAIGCAKDGDGFAVFLCDLDHFKAVNDSLGHPIGDRLIRAVAKRLKLCVKAEDIVARLGGDEFAIIARNLGGVSDADACAAKIAETVSQPYFIDGHQIIVGVSTGVAWSSGALTGAETLMQMADIALYKAKEDGRNTFKFFVPQMMADVHEKRALEVELRDALEQEQLSVHFQPIIDCATRQTIAFEALARWNHPIKGNIPPFKFIPVAEERGLIVPMGRWILREACAKLATLPSDLCIAVNISPVQLRHEDFTDHVRQVLGDFNLDPARLELEVTEAVLMDDNEPLQAKLQNLRGLGVKIAMDDFGTGYSSLSYLRKFPFDRIKIDRSFISRITSSPRDLAIVKAVVDLARSLNLSTTAEGVETEDQYNALRGVGCTELQGYLFGQPAAAGEAFAPYRLPVLRRNVA